MEAFWAAPKERLYRQLQADIIHGLTWAESRHRLRLRGYNEVRDDQRQTLVKILSHQLKSPFAFILLVAALISLLQGHIGEFWVIAAVVAANASIGAVEEYRSEKTMAKLRSIIAPQARVIREAIEQKIPAKLLVPGDVVILEAGDRVPADGRVIEAQSFRVNQASLTGEALPVLKRDTIIAPNAALIDRDNMVYLSTLVIAGRATVLITDTGANTELGQIAKAVKAVRATQSDLERKLVGFNQMLLLIAALGSILIFGIGAYYKVETLSMLTTALAMLVSVVPEGLPIALTVVLSVGLTRLFKRHSIIRNLGATETLGSLTTLVLDKTGTLTEGELVVEKIYTGGQEFRLSGRGYGLTGSFYQNEEKIDPQRHHDLRLLLELTSLATTSTISAEDLKRDAARRLSDPTETALAVAAAKGGFLAFEHEKKYPEILEIPFDDELRYSVSVHDFDDKARMIVKGIPERIIDHSSSVHQGKTRHLSAQDKTELTTKAAEYGQQGYRVIAVAFADQKSTEKVRAKQLPKLTFMGLLLMTDPIRPEAAKTIEAARVAGVRTIMVTGDHLLTAEHIARRIGLLEQGIAVDCGEVLHRDLGGISVIARATPQEKLLIVERLQKRGEIVAMTGDGVNDAPALKKADVGIAMGRAGSDIAIESSDMVLLNDNAATIVEAISQGRLIWDNLRKIIFYLTSTSFGELLVIIFALFLQAPLPLLAVHILWMNLVTDGVTSMALTTEQAEGELMKRNPRPTNEPLVTASIFRRMILLSLVMAAGALFVYMTYLPYSLDYARSAVLTTLVFFQLFNLFNSRSATRSIFAGRLLANRLLVMLAVLALMLQLAALYLPPLQQALQTVPLDLSTMIFCVSVAASIILADELRKMIRQAAIGWARLQQAFS